MATEMDSKKICELAEKLFQSEERTNAEQEWDLITEFMLTNQSGIFQVDQAAKGTKRTRRVYNTTAGMAARDLAAAIHSVMTNPAAPWVQLRFADDELNENNQLKNFLESAKVKLINELNVSNFNTELSKSYRFFTTVANMALLHEEEDYNEQGQFNGFRFKALHLAELAWTENAKSQIDQLFRKFKLTASQAVERWGHTGKLSEKIVKSAMDKPNEEFCFLQAIMPRQKVKMLVGARPLKKEMPYANIYLDLEDKVILEEDGYQEFPVHVVRWETMPGEVYGRGPGNLALPEVRTLNRAQQLSLQAWDKAINPPLLANQKDLLSSLDLRPNGITLTKGDISRAIAIIPQGSDFRVMEMKREEYETKIKEIFFLDKLLLPPREQTGEMTAFEVAQRLEQMQRVLGPTLGRLNSELLDPLIKRCFNMMLRGGAFGELPAELKEMGKANIQIEYVNPLSRSQRIADVSSIQAWVQDLGAYAQLSGSLEALDNVNVDGIARHTAKVRGVPEIAMRSEEEIQKMRQARQEQMQAEMALEAGVKTADIQSKNAKANRDGGGDV